MPNATRAPRPGRICCTPKAIYKRTTRYPTLACVGKGRLGMNLFVLTILAVSPCIIWYFSPVSFGPWATQCFQGVHSNSGTLQVVRALKVHRGAQQRFLWVFIKQSMILFCMHLPNDSWKICPEGFHLVFGVSIIKRPLLRRISRHLETRHHSCSSFWKLIIW